MPVPSRPQIFHITHVDNLASIVRDGGLYSDAEMISRHGGVASIGMSRIKQRRLTLPVGCHPGDFVGECVPFYFCPGANYAEFRDSLDQLGELDWAAIRSTDFRSPAIKEGKQAEFLVRGFVPWELVVRIGVHSSAMQERATAAISSAAHQPQVDVLPRWYY